MGSRLLTFQSPAYGKSLVEFQDFQRTGAVTNVKGDRRNLKKKKSAGSRHNLPGMENPLGAGNKGERMTDLYSWDTEIS